MYKGSKLYSIFRFKCPRCHEGDFFTHPSAYRWKNSNELLPECTECGLNYQPETGFYFGASYVSYAITVALAVAVTVALLPFVSWRNEVVYISAIAGTIFLTLPLSIRLSRIIWLNLFIRYKTPEQRKQEGDARLDFSDIRRRKKGDA